jgi:hypothetical protein
LTADQEVSRWPMGADLSRRWASAASILGPDQEFQGF